MTDNNKFIPKIPETKTEIVLNQEQQRQQAEQKSITEKVKEAVVPTVHASDDGEKVAKGLTTAANAAAVGAATVVNPLAGAVVGGLEAAAGGIMRSSDDEETKEAGRVFGNAATIGGGLGGAASAGGTLAKKGIDATANEAVKQGSEAIAEGASEVGKALGS